MKTTIVKIVAGIIFLALAYYLLQGPGKRFATAPYEAKIDSLASEIKGIEKQNDSLEATITVVEKENQVLEQGAKTLTSKIKSLKQDNSKLIAAAAYHPHQVDSFFAARYKDQYKIATVDTTHLPIPVSKAVVVDLLDFDRTKNVVLNQDSLINNLQSTLGNKDKIIITLRTKEDNYQSIISKQVQQQENYKIIVDGLKTDLKKTDWKIKKGKITTFALGTLALGLLVTHK